MVGNFVIGAGVMVVPGTLNDISHSLQVSIPQAGFLITAGAILMGLGAPVLASVVAGWDRRRLLTLTLIWYGALLAACAVAPGYDALLPLRVLAMLAPAIFTPQAAASIGLMVSPERRGKAITFVFLGWSVASVAGMPLGAWVGETWGWRWAFGGVAVLALLCAAWVWRAMPNGIRPAALSRQAWGRALGSKPLMLAVGVTLLSAFGQFTLFSYFAPFFKQTLQADAQTLSLLFLWFGAFGLLGNLVLTRVIDRTGCRQRGAAHAGADGAVTTVMAPGQQCMDHGRGVGALGIGLFCIQLSSTGQAGEPVAGTGTGHHCAEHVSHVRRPGLGRCAGWLDDCPRPDAAIALGQPDVVAVRDGAECLGAATGEETKNIANKLLFNCVNALFIDIFRVHRLQPPSPIIYPVFFPIQSEVSHAQTDPFFTSGWHCLCRHPDDASNCVGW
jgi:predicted MFS family arabinose efflux permease